MKRLLCVEHGDCLPTESGISFLVVISAIIEDLLKGVDDDSTGGDNSILMRPSVTKIKPAVRMPERPHPPVCRLKAPPSPEVEAGPSLPSL